jgi:hypothetical protein
MRTLAVEGADPRWAVKLVTGKSVEIDIQRLHVHRSMHRALATIGQHRHAALMRKTNHFA